MLNAVGRFLRRPEEERSLLFEAACNLALARLAVMFVPFRRLAPFLRRPALAPVRKGKAAQLELINWAISAASRRVPWRSRCLVQAIAGKLMLRRRGVANVLYLGVAKDDGQQLIAHAWLTSSTRLVTGGAEGERQYTALTRFIDGEETEGLTSARWRVSGRDITAGGNMISPAGPYLYQSYGLNLSADFPLACLDETGAAGPNEVRLVLGDLPAELPGATIRDEGGALCAGGKVLFNNPRVAFFIEDGSRVLFPPAFARCAGEDQWFRLHVALAHLLRLRGCIFLHASAVEREGRAYLFLGQGGSGKSTTVAALTLMGCRHVADDVSALTFAPDGKPSVLPGNPRQDLRADAVAQLGIDSRELIWSEETAKYSRRIPPDSVRDVPSLAGVFHLQPGECATPVLERLDGLERLQVMLEGNQNINDYHPRAYFMERLAGIAGHAAFYRLTRPRAGATLQAALALIEKGMDEWE